MNGRACVKSGNLHGTEVVEVDVEVAVSPGIDGFHIIGMVDTAVLEARERVRAAVKSAGFTIPHGNILVNLAPNSIRKTGSGYDLAIAAALLAATGQVDPKALDGLMLVGELALSGDVRPVRGLLCHALHCRGEGAPTLACAAHAEELAGLPDEVVPVGNLRDLHDARPQEGFWAASPELASELGSELGDYAAVPGQALAKRACQIAAAGRLGLMLVGPAGSGKSMLAHRLTSIMPAAGPKESLAIAAVQSAAGMDPSSALAGRRPLRAPHHSVTAPGLVGGGNPVMPGEASLASGGVLYLEGIQEMRAQTLQQLRPPLERGKVVITRADGTIEYPADFMLAASADPCPCGRFGATRGRECTCSAVQVARYRDRIAGPLANKFDVWADVHEGAGFGEAATQSSAQLLEGVEAAWEFREARNREEIRPLPGNFDDEASRSLKDYAKKLELSGQAIVSAARCARAIADIEQSEKIRLDHVSEALSYSRR